MGIQRSLAAVLLGLVASTWGAIAVAQTEFKILDRAVLTIRHPEGITDERVRQMDERLVAIVEAADDEQLDVTVEGDEQGAQLLINDTLLLDVTLEDAEANQTNKAIALAEVWGDRLVAVLEQPEVVRELFRTANMPEQLTVAGRRYVMMSEPVADLGQFVTDGSRVADRVIFWVDESSSARDRNTSAPDPNPATLPNPVPEQVYVLNRYREFIPYRAI
ncbi:MAG: hypothetical protein AAF974_01010 [Cyanobacteria bacterium P01_E01_bin.34]